MWFGTRDGLNRYDGSGFKVYKHDPQNRSSLGHNQVTALAEDQAGMLWIGTDGGGLDRLDLEAGAFVHYRHNPGDPTSLADNLVLSLLVDRDGVLWIGTGNGLDRLDRTAGQFIHHRNNPGDPYSLRGGTIESIYQDREGMLWVGTNGSGLNRLHPTTGRFTHFQHDPNDPHSLISNYLVRAIYEDRQGNLWIGTFEGLDRLDRQSGRMVHYQHDPSDPHSLSNNTIASLHQDPSGRLWVGTLGGGLDILDPATDLFVHYPSTPHDSHSLSSNMVLSMYEGPMGVLWIGTVGGGVNQADPLAERFALFQNDPDDPNSLSNNIVSSIFQDRQANLWIGTLGGGLNRFDRATSSWHLYRNDPSDPNSLSNNNVSAIYEDSEGVLWIGTLGGGLDRLDRRAERFTHVPSDPKDPQSLGNPFVYSILEDRQGRLWVATDEGVHGGLHRFDREREQLTHFRHDPNDPGSVSSNWVRALDEDRSGALWISAVGAGINRFDPITKRFKRYQHDPNDPNSLSHDSVTVIHEDQAGMLWLGTDGGGLNRLDPESGTFVHYTVEDGLPSDAICGILEDAGGGYLWISTSDGLSRFDPRTDTFRNFDASDGLQGNEFNVRASFRSSRGEMFFGGVSGFNAFYPDRVKDNPLIPPVILTSLRQKGEDVPLRTTVEHAEEVRFGWPDNSFEFEFAALSYIQPEKNQYAYMLEGFDTGWNYVGSRPYGRYTNLPGGTFTLHIKGSNNDGAWNEEGSALAITIVPPFWATWWFRGIVILALLAVAISGYRLRVRSIEARSRTLERLVDERTKELANRTRELAAVNSVVSTVSRSLDLRWVLTNALDKTLEVMDSEAGGICLVHQGDGKILTLAAHRGLSAPFRAQVDNLPVGEGFLARVVQTGEPVVAQNLARDPRPGRSMVEESDSHSLAAAPLIARGEVLGTVFVVSQGHREFSPQEIDLLASIGGQVGVAVENAQLHEEAQRVAVVEERQRLARELHDSVTQALHSSSLLAEAGRRLASAGDLERTRSYLARLGEISQQALKEMRLLVYELRPLALAEVGLARALRQRLDAVELRAGVEARLDVEGEIRLPVIVEEELYRIAQEALNNALKHAEPASVTVAIRTEGEPSDQWVELEVVDDGTGFDVDAATEKGGMGLVSMRERAENLGGTLQVKSAPGKGTRVSVRLATGGNAPLPEETQPQDFGRDAHE